MKLYSRKINIPKMLLVLILVNILIQKTTQSEEVLVYCFEGECEFTEKDVIREKITQTNKLTHVILGNNNLKCSEFILLNTFTHQEGFTQFESMAYRCKEYRHKVLITFGIYLPNAKKNVILLKQKHPDTIHLHINPLEQQQIKTYCISLDNAIISPPGSKEKFEITKETGIEVSSTHPQGKSIQLKTTICTSPECDINLLLKTPQIVERHNVISNCADCKDKIDYMFSIEYSRYLNCIIRLWTDGPPEIVIPCNYKATITLNMLELEEQTSSIWAPANYEECMKTAPANAIQCEYSHYVLNSQKYHYTDTFRLDISVSDKIIINHKPVDLRHDLEILSDALKTHDCKNEWKVIAVSADTPFRKDWILKTKKDKQMCITWITRPCVKSQECLDGHIIQDGNSRTLVTGMGTKNPYKIPLSEFKLRSSYSISEGILVTDSIEISTTGYIKGAKSTQEVYKIWKDLFIEEIDNVLSVEPLDTNLRYTGLYTSCDENEPGRACVDSSIAQIQCKIYSMLDPEIKCTSSSISKGECKLEFSETQHACE